MRTALRSDPLLSLLLDAEDELAPAWCARFEVGTFVPATARDVLHQVLVAIGSETSAAGLSEAAYALGVLRAQQGRDPMSIVEDVLALRPHLWRHVAGLPDVLGDSTQLLVVQQRIAEVMDQVLRCTVDAYVEESQRVLSARATRDQLTGLLNRAAFDEALHHEVAARDKGNGPTLLLIDLDGFKAVNDDLGHLAGDDVLVRVAQVLEASFRRGDVVARLGGDEFAVLLPRTPQARGVVLARRLLGKVREDEKLNDSEHPIGLSIGVGHVEDVNTGALLVSAADAAMYRAKRAGGHRAEASSPEDARS